MVVFLTPAGTRDEGGAIQPAYLNFDAALLGPPAHGLKVRESVFVSCHHHTLAQIVLHCKCLRAHLLQHRVLVIGCLKTDACSDRPS